MDLSIRTRTRGGEDTRPACQRDRRGGLGHRIHTCLTHRTAGQIASDERARQLARMRPRTR